MIKTIGGPKYVVACSCMISIYISSESQINYVLHGINVGHQAYLYKH